MARLAYAMAVVKFEVRRYSVVPGIDGTYQSMR
jgi:hypothetical protein